MHRRVFLKRFSGGIALTLLPSFACTSRSPLRFGILTDAHYANRDASGTRYYKDSIEKLQNAIDFFNRADLDFIIELGDFKDMDASPDRTETLEYLKSIERVYKGFSGPSYHVLGNHDMDCISKDDFLQYTSNPGHTNKKTYYSFEIRGVKCIVLDANFNEDGSPYDSGNFNWTRAYIPQEQLEWLRNELKQNKKPTLIFVHQLLDAFSDISPSVCVNNANEVTGILDAHDNILAVFQGHHHAGHYSYRNNIHYWTMKGMIEGPLPEHNSYAIVEINRNHDISISGLCNCESRNLFHEKV